jgi:hypothetical protein
MSTSYIQSLVSPIGLYNKPVVVIRQDDPMFEPKVQLWLKGKLPGFALRFSPPDLLKRFPELAAVEPDLYLMGPRILEHRLKGISPSFIYIDAAEAINRLPDVVRVCNCFLGHRRSILGPKQCLVSLETVNPVFPWLGAVHYRIPDDENLDLPDGYRNRLNALLSASRK